MNMAWGVVGDFKCHTLP